MQYRQSAESQAIIQSTRMSWKRQSTFLLPSNGFQNKYPVYWPRTARTVIHLLSLFKEHFKSITTDNGPEFAAHKDITKYLGVPVYFAAPYCSWQKGVVENTNKLIRQYIPKKDSFDNYTDKRIMSIQKKLNERPREKLNFSTPKCEFFKHVL